MYFSFIVWMSFTLRPARCPLHAAPCLPAARCPLPAARCPLPAARCALSCAPDAMQIGGKIDQDQAFERVC